MASLISASSSAGVSSAAGQMEDGGSSAVGVASVSSSDMAAVRAADQGEVIIGIETGEAPVSHGSAVFEIETIETGTGEIEANSADASASIDTASTAMDIS